MPGSVMARARRGQLVCADKANVMETYVLWREVVSEVALEYPDVAFECLYADNVSYQLARDPKRFDVILSDNLFGDMLSDQAGAIAGSLGMLPSACLSGLAGDGGRTSGIYEPVHGSAPGHRRGRHRQPDRHDPVGCHDVRTFLRSARYRTAHRGKRQHGPRRRMPHGRPGRHGNQHGDDRSGSAGPALTAWGDQRL